MTTSKATTRLHTELDCPTCERKTTHTTTTEVTDGRTTGTRTECRGCSRVTEATGTLRQESS